MDEKTTNLMFEILRAIRGKLDSVEQKVDQLALRVSGIDNAIAGLKHDVAHHYSEVALVNARFDGMMGRLERIERRLELTPP